MKNQPPKTFPPAIPIPFVLTPAHRVRMLKETLNNPNHAIHIFVPRHIPNLIAVIQAYESNSMPSEGTVYFKDGKRISKEEADDPGSLVWTEVRFLFINEQIFFGFLLPVAKSS